MGLLSSSAPSSSFGELSFRFASSTGRGILFDFFLLVGGEGASSIINRYGSSGFIRWRIFGGRFLFLALACFGNMLNSSLVVELSDMTQTSLEVDSSDLTLTSLVVELSDITLTSLAVELSDTTISSTISSLLTDDVGDAASRSGIVSKLPLDAVSCDILFALRFCLPLDGIFE